ncbi:MAG: hypothetical protein NG747_14760 [Candidatus Brocadia sp.]|nr:hypothetical protein [Candidatus Brocadia sp.]
MHSILMYFDWGEHPLKSAGGWAIEELCRRYERLIAEKEAQGLIMKLNKVRSL